MFINKFDDHKYKKEILEFFDNDTSITEIKNWLEEKGEEHTLSGDTLRAKKKRHLDSKNIDKRIKDTEEELGSPETDIEGFLMETIGQCRARKESSTISGKDFQYYDQQMQSAIKLLNDIRGSATKQMSIADVFAKLEEGLDDEGTKTA